MRQAVKRDSTHKNHIITTIIPAYNAEKSICHALDSIRKQDEKNIQIIIIDDGSTDNTGIEVLSYMDMHADMDIVYLCQDNAGPGAARNLGLEYADGTYICFLDSDDFVPAHAYKQYLNVANTYDCDVVIGSYMRRVDNEKWYIPDYIRKLCHDSDGINLAGDYVVAMRNPSLWNRMYKRDFLNSNKIRFLNENHGEDCVFNLDVLKYAASVYTTDSICYCYSKRLYGRDSVSTSWSYVNTISRIRAIDTYFLYFDGIGDVYAESVYINSHISYLMDGIRTIKDKDERNSLYQSFMVSLSKYIGNKKYEKFISAILGIDLDIAVLLTFDAYLIQKQKFWNGRTDTASNNHSSDSTNQDSKDIVLQQFANGKIGFKYIIKYFSAWIKYKIHH